MSSLGVLSYIVALSVCRQELSKKPVMKWIRLAVLAALCASHVVITFIQGTEGWYYLDESFYCRSRRGPGGFRVNYSVSSHPLCKSLLLVLRWLCTVILLTPGWTEVSANYFITYFSWLDRTLGSLLRPTSRKSANQPSDSESSILLIIISFIKAIIVCSLWSLLSRLFVWSAWFFSPVLSIMTLVVHMNGIHETRRRGHALMQSSEAQVENEWSFGQIVPASMLIATLIMVIDTFYSRFIF